MKYIYIGILFVVLCDHDKVRGSGGIVPRRGNDIYGREQRTATAKNSRTVAKHSGRKLENGGETSNRRLFGRHVCAHNRVKMLPLKEVQSYCKPAYQSYLRRCDKDKSLYCTGYRVAYELAYRTVQKLVAKTETSYSCCPGWTQAFTSSTDCKQAICKEECKNGGICMKPEHCTCLPGWTGKTCESDIDECSSDLNVCEQNCINKPGSYACLCKDGFSLQANRKSCKKIAPTVDSTKVAMDYTEALLEKMEVIQKRLESLEEWRRNFSLKKTDDSINERDDRINSLSEQIAILEERLEECTCNKRDEFALPRPQ